MFSVVEPKIPDAWLDRFLKYPEQTEPGPFDRYLPADVRAAAAAYADAKQQLHAMNGR